MSKGNLFLGFARKSVGDVTFYRAHGEQIARARNRNPKNPRTSLQLCQRVLMRTASQAYSLFQPIADHSFQGREVGTANQSRFIQLNVQAMREQLVVAGDYQNPDNLPFSEEVNFSGRLTPGAVIRPYIIAEGSLPSPVVKFADDSGNRPAFLFANFPPKSLDDMSYDEFIAVMGLERGDQLTFVWGFFNDSASGLDYVLTDVAYARVILEPADGDFAGKFIQTTQVRSPNAANSGYVQFEAYDTGSTYLGGIAIPDGGTAPGGTHVYVSFGMIVSRKVGGQWLRSNSKMVLRPYSGGTGAVGDYDQWELGDAIMSFMTEQQSSLYLNQAKGF